MWRSLSTVVMLALAPSVASADRPIRTALSPCDRGECFEGADRLERSLLALENDASSRSDLERAVSTLRDEKEKPASGLTRLRKVLKSYPMTASQGRSKTCRSADEWGCGVGGGVCETRAGFVIEAVRSFGSAAEDAVPELLRLARHPDVAVRTRSTEVLAEHGYAEGIRTYVDLLDSQDWACRDLAFHVLERAGPKATAAIPALERFLESGPWDDRADAAKALAAIGTTAAIAPLRAGLLLPDFEAQEAAARGLGQLGPAAVEALPVLRELARSHWWFPVRLEAATAIRSITGKAVAPTELDCRRGIPRERVLLEDPPVRLVSTLRLPKVLYPLVLDSAGTPSWLSLEHRGEFGGAVYVTVNGRSTTIIDDESTMPAGFITFGTKVLLVERLCHLVGCWGRLRTVAFDGQRYRLEPFLDLPGAPEAVGTDPDGNLIVRTGISMRENPCIPDEPFLPPPDAMTLRISPAGEVDEVAADGLPWP